MIITRTPFRASFVGGGSDVRWFYQSHGYGAVLSAAIKRYMYIVIHPYFHDKRIRLKYSKTEDISHVDQIEHKIIRACLKRFNLEGGIEIASFADVPAGTGLGSSSAFTVGLLHALYAWKSMLVSKHQLAEEACEIEIDVLGKPIGKQDQFAAAYGGLNVLRFNRDESVTATPVLLSTKSRTLLEKRLRLYHVSGSRSADDILADQNSEKDRKAKHEQLRGLLDLVEPLRRELGIGNVDAVGEMLHRGWIVKKGITSGISSDDIDHHYHRAIEAGATGGKLLGAGGTGFLMLYGHRQDQLEEQLGLRSLPFSIDDEGTKVVFFEPDS